MRFGRWLIYLLALASWVNVEVYAADQTPPLVLFRGNNRATGAQLWQTENTAEGTHIFSVLTKTPNADTEICQLGRLGNIVLFSAYAADTGEELWRSDGTPEGTFLVKDIAVGAESSLSANLFCSAQQKPLGQRLVLWGTENQRKALMITPKI